MLRRSSQSDLVPAVSLSSLKLISLAPGKDLKDAGLEYPLDVRDGGDDDDGYDDGDDNDGDDDDVCWVFSRLRLEADAPLPLQR